jgi:hypothetical protein
MFTQYTHQLCYVQLLVILYEELLLNKAAIYGGKKDELLVWKINIPD